MKYSILLILGLATVSLVILSGCAHVRIAGFDKQANTVTLTGGKPERLQIEAERYCGGRAELIAMHEKYVGSQTVVHPNINVATTQKIRAKFLTYRCVR